MARVFDEYPVEVWDIEECIDKSRQFGFLNGASVGGRDGVDDWLRRHQCVLYGGDLSWEFPTKFLLENRQRVYFAVQTDTLLLKSFKRGSVVRRLISVAWTEAFCK